MLLPWILTRDLAKEVHVRARDEAETRSRRPTMWSHRSPHIVLITVSECNAECES
jgi:hypothetical protein